MSYSVFLLGLLFSVTFGEMVKRSDDPVPLEDVVSRLSVNLQNLQSQVAFQQREIDLLNTKVGFMTKVAADFTQNSAGEIVKLSAVQYNEGQGYDPMTGIFTAPVAGLYSFFLKTETAPNQTTGLFMMHEGNQLLYLYGGNPNSHLTPSGDVVVHLRKGERVWVEGVYRNNTVRSWTRFGGFLVHTDNIQ